MKFDLITFAWQIFNLIIALAIPIGLVALLVSGYRKLKQVNRNIEELTRDVAEIKDKLNNSQ